MTPIISQPSPAFDVPSQDFGRPEDRDLTRRIVGFLTAHGLLTGASLLLKVDSGHVELRGTVAAFRQRDRIDSFVRRVAGVHEVTNQLVVGTPAPAASRNRLLDHHRQPSLASVFQD